VATRDLAERLDADPMLVSKWERGEHTPSAKYLSALALVFDRDLGWFYADHETRSAA
jgi:transcriptional regulator with XRE-family HTH domain